MARHRAQPPRHQRGIRQPRNSQAGIEAFADQVHGRIAEVKIDADFGILLQEFRQQRRHRLDPERHRHCETHQPARRHRLRQRLVLRRLAIGKQARRARGQLLPGIGQGEPPRGAVEQPGAEPLLQPADRLRDRRLG
jgi:hypothetical protein